MNYSATLYYETLNDNEKCKHLLTLFESNNDTNYKAVKEIKKKVEQYYDKLPESFKTTVGYLNFDTYIARTFGFGITSLINPVLQFLETQKLEAKPEEVALLVLGVGFSLLKDTSSQQVAQYFKSLLSKPKYFESVLSVLSKVKKYGVKALVKFLEYLAYTSLAIPAAGATLSVLSGSSPNTKQALSGLGLAAVSQLARALLSKKTTS